MNKDTGGPAFPAQHFDLTDAEHGMTLRDYFAAKAMQGIIASTPDRMPCPPDEATATRAYRYADAMLKAREQ